MAFHPTHELLDHPYNEKPSCNQSILLEDNSSASSLLNSHVIWNQEDNQSFADCVHLSIDSFRPVDCVPNLNAITHGIRSIAGINVLIGIDVALINLFLVHSALLKSVID